MEAKTSEWRPGPAVCRCCLAEGCYKDISTEYFWMGKREVYAEMLADTLNLSIAYSKSGGPNSNSRLICEPCISRLRDAADFKRQVLECEKTFLHHLDPSASSATATDLSKDFLDIEEREVKIERVKVERLGSDDEFDGTPNFDMDDDDDDLDDQPLTTLASKVSQKSTSVDMLDLMDNAKVAEKRKSTDKVKATPAKKVKIKKDAKASASKAKPEKKKRGHAGQTESDPNVQDVDMSKEQISELWAKQRMLKSARAVSRSAMKKNAGNLLECWTIYPFKWRQSKFICAYCDAGFVQVYDLREHVRSCSVHHSVDDIFRGLKGTPLIKVDITDAVCRFCSCPFPGLGEMRQHAVQHGFKFDTGVKNSIVPFILNDEVWHCAMCEASFSVFFELYKHMNTHYERFSCGTCGKGYMTAIRLKRHEEGHVKGSFPCDLCDETFTVRTKRYQHKAQVHSKGPRYACPHCEIRFHRYDDRVKHLRDYHKEIVPIKCIYCDRTFENTGRRRAHVYSVHMQTKHKCTYCEASFGTQARLKNHVVKHTGEKKFSCKICGNKYPRSAALWHHLRSHNYRTCKLCEVMFNRRSDLDAHICPKRTIKIEIDVSP